MITSQERGEALVGFLKFSGPLEYLDRIRGRFEQLVKCSRNRDAERSVPHPGRKRIYPALSDAPRQKRGWRHIRCSPRQPPPRLRDRRVRSPRRPYSRLMVE